MDRLNEQKIDKIAQNEQRNILKNNKLEEVRKWGF